MVTDQRQVNSIISMINQLILFLFTLEALAISFSVKDGMMINYKYRFSFKCKYLTTSQIPHFSRFCFRFPKENNQMINYLSVLALIVMMVSSDPINDSHQSILHKRGFGNIIKGRVISNAGSSVKSGFKTKGISSQ